MINTSNISISGVGISISDAFKEYVHTQVQQIEHYTPHVIWVKITITQNHKEFKSHIQIHSKLLDCDATNRSYEAYESFRLTFEEILKQFRRKKRQLNH